jgi:thiosulfate/3-mercaptopyruvate sulfurtransferase
MTLTVDANWLLSCLEDQDIVILDCRGIMPYKFGHIKNAIPLGLERVISVAKNGANLVIDAKTAEQVFTELGIDSSKTVVLYGEYPDPSVARIAWTLIYHGQQNVKLLKIAYSDWHKLGLPTARQNPTRKPTAGVSFVSKVNPRVRADAEMIKEKQNDAGVIIVDARTPQEHFQARIPGSILFSWEEGLGNEGKMIKDKSELERDFERKGITKDKEIICYCHSGMRASHQYLQLIHAGFDNARVYDGSIIDWAQRRNPLR